MDQRVRREFSDDFKREAVRLTETRVWMKPQMSAAPHIKRAPKRGSPARSDQCLCRSAPRARPIT